MERSDVLDAMGKLKLYGMRASYDEIITTAVKRQHEPQQIIGDYYDGLWVPPQVTGTVRGIISSCIQFNLTPV